MGLLAGTIYDVEREELLLTLPRTTKGLPIFEVVAGNKTPRVLFGGRGASRAGFCDSEQIRQYLN